LSSSSANNLLPVANIQSELLNLNEILQDLQEKMGKDFEKSVCEAMKYLDLTASLTQTTEAESDVIVEALHAEAPYFVVIECQAVREGNQVGYDKVGQIRGNAASYLDTRRQTLFENAYKLVVGKPEFSEHAKEKATPDVGLISVVTLSHLMRLHQRFQFSQDVLQEIFSGIGEIDVDKVNSVVIKYLKNENYYRRLSVYSLIYLALIEDPFSESKRRKKWTPITEVVGSVLTYSKLFRIRDLTTFEIRAFIRDLDNPFIRIIESRESEIRLSTLSLDVIKNFSPLGESIVSIIKRYWEKLRIMEI
jgi:hypothetical protein